MNLVLLAALLACRPPPVAAGDSGDSAPPTTDAPLGKPILGLCDAWDVPELYSPADLTGWDARMDEVSGLGLPVARPHRARGHAFAWNIVQRDNATLPFDWSLPDAVVRETQARGVAVDPTIYVDTAQSASGENGSLPPVRLPDDVTGYNAFLAAMIERYDHDGVDDMPGLVTAIDTWEIGNEPGCAPGDLACADAFYDIVADSYPIVKQAEPTATVIAAGAATVISPDGTMNQRVVDTYERFFADGGLDVTDAISFHMATGDDTPVQDHLAWWTPRVHGKPLWIGEIGTRQPDSANSFTDDPKAEADWLTTQFQTAFDQGVARVYWCATGGDLLRYPDVDDAVRAETSALADP